MIYWIRLVLSLLLALTLALSQIIQIDQQLQQDNQTQLEPNQQVNFIQCPPGTYLENGQCFNFESQQDQYTRRINSQQFVACQGQSSCSLARGFSNEEQYKQFMTQLNKAYKSVSQADKRFQSIQPDAKKLQNSRQQNQVKGVDQPDTIKTDGQSIYIIQKGNLIIVETQPIQRDMVSSTNKLNFVKSGRIFVEDGYLAYIVQVVVQGSYTTYVQIYNVRNKWNPQQIYNFTFDGYYDYARKTSNGFVYLVVSQTLNKSAKYMYSFEYGRKQLNYSSIFYFPQKYTFPSLKTIVAFNLKDAQNRQNNIIGIFCQSRSMLYMTEKAIYLSSWINQSNKQIYTKIRKIEINQYSIKPIAITKIRGRVKDSYSFDQYGPFLRVHSYTQMPQIHHHIQVLGYYLQPYGRLTDIILNEKVTQKKFIGRRFYFLLQRQINPFIFVNFSSHKSPALQAIEVNGYFRRFFLHDELTMVICRDQIDESGTKFGIFISLVDVSNTYQPSYLNSLDLQDQILSYEAFWQDKGLLFQAVKNFFVIPAILKPKVNNGGSKSGDVPSIQSLIININKQNNEISLRTKINNFKGSSALQYYIKKWNVQRSIYNKLLSIKLSCIVKLIYLDKDWQVKEVRIIC